MIDIKTLIEIEDTLSRIHEIVNNRSELDRFEKPITIKT